VRKWVFDSRGLAVRTLYTHCRRELEIRARGTLIGRKNKNEILQQQNGRTPLCSRRDYPQPPEAQHRTHGMMGRMPSSY
jgi:hypothetical protein